MRGSIVEFDREISATRISLDLHFENVYATVLKSIDPGIVKVGD